jgi:pimeloyl-ACP methyl ester carboxylesterase
MDKASQEARPQKALQADERPMLVMWADSDPVLPFKVGEAFSNLIGADPPIKIENASHFLQEDAGPEIGGLIADWLKSGSK